ncbi:hypothetical protein pb186bvf_014278 [Paramecium bursaria]
MLRLQFSPPWFNLSQIFSSYSIIKQYQLFQLKFDYRIILVANHLFYIFQQLYYLRKIQIGLIMVTSFNQDYYITFSQEKYGIYNFNKKNNKSIFQRIKTICISGQQCSYANEFQFAQECSVYHLKNKKLQIKYKIIYALYNMIGHSLTLTPTHFYLLHHV